MDICFGVVILMAIGYMLTGRLVTSRWKGMAEGEGGEVGISVYVLMIPSLVFRWGLNLNHLDFKWFFTYGPLHHVHHSSSFCLFGFFSVHCCFLWSCALFKIELFYALIFLSLVIHVHVIMLLFCILYFCCCCCYV